MDKIEEVRKQVSNLLSQDDSGHAMDHIERVLKLSLKFAEKENANVFVVSLIALLHDVDDYKLFGKENAENLTNAKNIMNKYNISSEIQEQVLSSIHRLGYSKSLKGIRPITIEGQIVSDADMCDAIGVNGILRTYKYNMKHGKPFFDKSIFPIDDMNNDKYISKSSGSSVCHMFEKLLKLKKMMMTDAGIEEAQARHQIIVDVLYHLFDEENSPEWKEYLDKFLKTNYGQNKVKKIR
ncbi:MAG: HD domain-containing protein [Firmicutes bacterium]|nr:HD domain-containing protein [Bacillota bacterium]